MKKGCFLSFIVFGTIFLGVTFYIVDKHGDKIVSFFEERVIDLTTNSIEENILRLTDETQKEAVSQIWAHVYEESKKMEFEEGINYLSDVVSRIDRYTKDSLLTSDELSSLKEFIENESR